MYLSYVINLVSFLNNFASAPQQLCFVTGSLILFISHLQSVNGVWVNKERIPVGVPHVLEEGNTIWIGVPLNEAPVEYEYTLVRRRLHEVEGSLAKPLCPGMYSYKFIKHKMAKRKRPVDEAEVRTSPSSKSKLQRCCTPDHSPTPRSPLKPPCPERTPCPTGASPEAGPSEVAPAQGKTPTGGGLNAPEVGGHGLESVRHYGQNMQALKEQVEDTQKQVDVLEGQLQQDAQREQEVSGLRAQLEMLQGQLRSQQKQALSRMKSLEKTYCDEERRLEVRPHCLDVLGCSSHVFVVTGHHCALRLCVEARVGVK